jgi:WD40 repeat protein
VSAGWASALVEQVERQQPAVVHLAELASLAAQIDAPLLRRLRQSLLPGEGPGLEADLWFSALLESQDDEAGALHEAVALHLRERLRKRLQATGAPAFNRVARLVRAAHAHLPAAVRLEERLTALSFRGDSQDGARMEAALAPALRALAGPDETHALEVSRWAMQAAGRLPASVRALPSMQALLLAAALRLEQPALAGAAGSSRLPVEALSWLVPAAAASAPTTLGVALRADGILFGRAEESPLSLELPRTTPLLVSVRWRASDGEHHRLVPVAPGVLVAIEDEPDAVEIVTLAGDTYALTRVTTAAAAQSAVPDSVAAESPAPEARFQGVPGAFLDGCVLVEDLGATMGLAIAFPVADGLWASPREPFGTIPFVGVVDGATADQLELVNRDDEGTAVSLWRPLSTRRPGEPLPLLAAAAAPQDADWWTVTFVDGRPQVIPIRPREGVRGETFEIDAAAPVRFPGAPVLCGGGGQGTVAEMAVAGIVTSVESDANANAPSTGLLRVLSASALQEALARARVATAPEAIPDGAITCAQFLPGTRHLLLAGADGTLRLYDADSGALTDELAAHDGPVLSLAPIRSSDGNTASGGRDGMVRISRPGQPLATRTIRLQAPVRAIVGAPEGNGLTVGFADGRLQEMRKSLRGWGPFRQRDPDEPLTEGLNALAAIAEGDRFVSAADDGRLVVWDRRELKPIFELRDPDGASARALDVAATPDGRLAVAGYGDRTVRVWDLPSRRIRGLHRDRHRAGACAVAIADDGAWVVSGGTDGSVCLWMPESEGMLTTLIESGPPVRAVAVSSDGLWVASADDKGVARVWDAKPASLLRRFRSGSARIYVSCAPADLELVNAVVKALLGRGIIAHVDRGDSGPADALGAGVRRAIERSELVVAFVTEHSASAPRLAREIEHAQSVGKPLLSVATNEPIADPKLRAFLAAQRPEVLEPWRLEESAAQLAKTIDARLPAGASAPEGPDAVPPAKGAPQKAPARPNAKKEK